MFKPFNFNQSTFGGQAVPVKAAESKLITTENPLFAPAKATGSTVFDKQVEPAADTKIEDVKPEPE
jgi:hypothetical protein